MKNFLISIFLSISFTVFACPGTVNFTFPSPWCKNSPVTFTNTSTGAAATFTWVWGDASANTVVSGTASQTHTYTNNGTFTIKLIRQITSSGCKDSITHTINIINNNAPTPTFSFAPATGCASVPFSFLNTTGNSSMSYSWDFGDPSSGSQNIASGNGPNHEFSATGAGGTSSFTVSLTATSAQGCTNTSTQTLTVTNKPDATLLDSNIFSTFSNCGNPSLSPASPDYHIAVQNGSTTAATNTNYSINWGDGSPVFSAPTFTQVSHNYSNLGIFTITFSVTGAGGCVTTKTYTVFNLTNPSVGLNSPGSTVGCTPLTLTFPVQLDSANLNYTTYTFDFDDGTPLVQWTPPGLATSISHTYTTASCGKPGNQFTVKVTAKNACDSTSATVNSIKISSKPTANFTAAPNPGCINVPIVFTNLTTPGCNAPTGSTITSYVWNFGDGSPSTPVSTIASPQSHTYTAVGTYNVTLTATSSCGPSIFTLPVEVKAPPIANFTFTPPGCAPTIVNTTNLSSGTGLSYNWSATPGTWNFVAPFTADSTQPPFNFTAAATYTIHLVTTNVCGVSVKDSILTVKSTPSIVVAPLPNVCVPNTITPSATTTNGGGTISAYSWSFVGGTPASATTQIAPSVAYNTSGTYNVIGTATNECGIAKDTVTFTVNPQPSANAGFDSTICLGESTTIGTASVGGLTYSWTSVPAGFSSTSANSSVTPTVNTTYGLTVSNGSCSKTDSVKVIVNPLPTLILPSPQTICGASAPIVLTGNPTGGTWSGTGINATGTFSPAAAGVGTHTLTYNFTNSTTTCSNSATTTITVEAAPSVIAGPDFTECNQAGTITLTGFSPAGGTWSGLGVSPTGVFTPTAAGVGTNNLIYTFTSVNGCVGKDTLIATVTNPTIAVAGINDTVCLNAASFNLSGYSPAGGTWSGTAVTAAGNFNPTTAGVGTHTLTYTTGVGTCASNDTKEIIVKPLPTVNAGVNQNVCIDAVPFNFTGFSPVGGTWTGTGITNGALGTFNPSTAGAGIHILTYTFTDPITNCPNTATKTVTVNALPIVNAGTGSTYCNQAITFNLSGYSPAGGTWSGIGVTGAGSFNPSIPALGNNLLTYTFVDGNGCSNSDTIKNTIIAPSIADAGINDTVCVSDAAFNLSGFTPIGGTWSGTGVNASGLFTPSAAGAGTFTLTYTYGVGTCLTSDTKIIKVNALPIVSAGINETVCVNSLAFNLTGYSPIGGAFSGTGITNASLGTFDPAIAGVGTFTITYTYTDPITTCLNTSTKTITVNTLPIVDAGTGYVVCDQPITVTLTGFSPIGGTWSGSGVTNTGIFNPSTAGVGTHTLTYSFTSGIGCTNTDTIIMTVIPPQIADAGLNDTICLNNGLLNLAGFSPLAGTWTGTGITSASGTFNPSVSGVGTFTLTYTFGAGTCLTTDTKIVVVKPLPIMSAGTNEITCISSPAFSLSGFSPLGGIWSGTGVTGTGLFTPSTAGVGIHTLTYTYTDPTTNCTDTRTKTVEVGALPNVSFTNPAVGCVNSSIPFTNSTSGQTQNDWDFGDTGTSTLISPTHTYTSIGNYTIELIATSILGCKDSLSSTIQIIQAPIANFTPLPDSGCSPLNVSFNNTSSGDYISYNWDLGNGITSVDTIAPSQTYNQGINDSTYYVTLTVTNQCASVFHSDSIIVMPHPSIDFGTNLNEGCSPFTVQFSNTSTGLPDSVTWDFGDGSAISTNFVTTNHTFYTGTNDTTFTITLIGWNECARDTMQHTVLVHPNTVNAFFNSSDTAGCVPHTVNFTDYSTGGIFVTWDFGDGNTSSQQNPSHTFTSAGTYIVHQYVNNGCSFDTTTMTITVHPTANLSFTSNPNPICANQPVTFTNTSVSAINFDWDFGDGGTSNLVSPSYNYSNSGTFTVTLIGTSITFGCKDSITQTVQVNALPIPIVSSDVQFGCMPLLVNFTNNSTNTTFHSWDFGDGNTSISATPAHTFTSAGIFTINYVAENLNGCKDSVQLQVNVYPIPNANFTLSNQYSCSLPTTVNTLNNSTGAIGYQWDFGNGNTSVLNNPTINYTAAGQYAINLIATNTYGCKDTAAQTFNAYITPTVSFTPSATIGCEPMSVTFANQTQNANTYLWQFSDGTTSTNAAPTHIFTSQGIYGATLIATSNATCSDTLILSNIITVNPSPTSDFTYEQQYTDGVPNGTIHFTNASIGATTYDWTFGDSAIEYHETHPTHQYPGVGEYSTSLITTNQYGCKDTLVKNIHVDYFQGLFVPNAFIATSEFNDLNKFIPKGKSLKTYRLQIYNTWGTLLFETSELDAYGSPLVGWDGYYQGEPVPQDVYVWKIEATFLNGSIWLGKEYPNGEVKPTGTITLIR